MTMPFWIGTSWKMNKTLGEAADYCVALHDAKLLRDPRLQGFVIPPFTALSEVCRALADTPVMVGAQNMHWAEQGAFTGEISPPMVKDCGADIVELGHSERREHFNETDTAINRKVKAALAQGLRPLICVGETAEEKAQGVAADTVIRQCRIALHGVAEEDLDKILIAYEPVWAIGTGETASPEQAQEAHHFLRQRLVAHLGTARSEALRILYGGSVKGANAAELAAQEDIDGFLVGGASLDAEEFSAIIQCLVARD